MLEFIFGYFLGSSNSNSNRSSGKVVAIGIAVFLLICVGAGLATPLLFPVSVVEECGGTAYTRLMCESASTATTFGVALMGLVIVAVVAVLVFFAPPREEG